MSIPGYPEKLDAGLSRIVAWTIELRMLAANSVRAITIALCHNSPMNLLLHLTPELESKLSEQAKALGKAPEEIALQVLKEQLDAQPLATATISPDQWVADIRSWAAGHRGLAHEADDSRDSIYAGRGE